MFPVPFDEQQRLAALFRYNVLDTGAEPAFDRITRMAARQLGVSIALISLVDPQRQWFKSKVGLDACETGRDISFCCHTILNRSIMEVVDASLDSRFAENPLVKGPPYIRYYAGAPLITPDGFQIGTLCIIDEKPRSPLSPGEQDLLTGLAEMVIDQFELRKQRSSADGPGQPAPQMAQHSDAPTAAAGRQDVSTLSVQAQQDLVAALSHELRSPLNAVLGYCDAIRQEAFGPGTPTKYLECADAIHESGEHLLGLVNRILDHAASAHDAFELEEGTVAIPDIAEKGLRMFTELARQAQVTLSAAVPDDLPALTADGQQVLQMLANLLGNAVKFTEPGGIVTLGASVRPDGDVALWVEDTGVGITPDNLARVTVPFQRIENALCGHGQGTGLGLALTKRLVEAHGGALELESALGRGTKVTLVFPGYRLKEAAEAARRA